MNSAAILMISIIVKNGKELTSKVLLRAPRWTWQMFIQKDQTKLIQFLKIAAKIANLNAPSVSLSSRSYASSYFQRVPVDNNYKKGHDRWLLQFNTNYS